MTGERQLEEHFIQKLRELKYEYNPGIRDRESLERNFREKFESLNRVNLTDGEFSRLLNEIITPDVYTAARTLRERNSFTRVDLLAPLDLSWKARTQKELALMDDLAPLLHKRAHGRDISGLSAYEQ